jgi:hypothetical protein
MCTLKLRPLAQSSSSSKGFGYGIKFERKNGVIRWCSLKKIEALSFKPLTIYVK